MDSPFERYLTILEVEPAPPSVGHLQRLVQAQLRRVPFENVSKLYGGRVLGQRFMPDLESHLDGIERWSFGGTCYPNNFHFNRLLGYLGYEVMLCGADMSISDAHLISMVSLDGRDYLVDVGYAAPFDGPLPLDLDHEFVIRHGRDRYVLHPRRADGRSRLDLRRDGTVIHGYLAKPVSRSIREFHRIIKDSYRLEATFMNVVIAQRFFQGGSVRLHNLKLTTVRGQKVTEAVLADHSEVVDALVDRFGMPRILVRQAIHGVGLTDDIYT